MTRDLRPLADHTHDVLVVGAGIHGASCARDAALRGLSVALIDRADFGGAASANSLRVLHGGLRHLRDFDLIAAHRALRERAILAAQLPHTIRPLPFLLPASGSGTQSAPALGAALALYRLLQASAPSMEGDRAGRLLDRRECLSLVPEPFRPCASGAALWIEAQLLDAERVTLEVVRAAARAGAVVSNWVELSGTHRSRGIHVLRALDLLTGDVLEITARAVLVSAGAWQSQVLRRLGWAGRAESDGLALAMNLGLKRAPGDLAIGFRSGRQDSVAGAGRLLFLTPWRESTLLGTWYRAARGGPGEDGAGEDDVLAFLDEVNAARPALGLTRDDVSFVQTGLLPAGQRGLARHARIDAGRGSGGGGIVSVVPIKFAGARAVAERAIDRLFEVLGRRPPPCRTAREPILVVEEETRPIPALPARLVERYGPRAREVLLAGGPEPLRPIAPGSPVLACEVTHALREEMAVRVEDIVQRRTDMGFEGPPPAAHVHAVARIAARELRWTERRTEEEVSRVLALRRGPIREPEVAR